jgi:hypothetical protein
VVAAAADVYLCRRINICQVGTENVVICRWLLIGTGWLTYKLFPSHTASCRGPLEREQWTRRRPVPRPIFEKPHKIWRDMRNQ